MCVERRRERWQHLPRHLGPCLVEAINEEQRSTASKRRFHEPGLRAGRASDPSGLAAAS